MVISIERKNLIMKISITNFGPIKQFDYDLTKDIVVTFGNNNIGKSYAMQLVYLLLKNLMEVAEFSGSFHYKYRFLNHDSESFNSIAESIQKFAKSSETSMNITDMINTAVENNIANAFYANFINSCENTFGNFKGIIEKNPIITLNADIFTIKLCLANKKPLSAKVHSIPTFLKKTSSDFHKSRNANGRLDIYYYDNVDIPASIIQEKINSLMYNFYTMISSTVGNVYFLPASRSGIYSGMSAFSSIIAELSKNKAMLTKKIELPGISEPISDYFLMLSNIRGRENSNLSKVYNQIEESILHGTVSFNRHRNTLVYTPEGVEHEFEMTEVSSMVSEISPIVAFFKYVITTSYRFKSKNVKPIVFIEEPEAHLHPKNQIELINLFAQLYKLGIKIVVSSHSNYIFNKLNNLLLKGEISPQTYSAILLTSKNGGSVSEFMSIDEFGVDDTNFVDVAQDLYNEREGLIESWNNRCD